MSSARELMQKIKDRKAISLLGVLATLSIGILIGTLISRGVGASQNEAKGTDAKQIILPSPQDLSTTFGKISKVVAPAVVNINTESTVRTISQRQRSPQGPLSPQGPQRPQGPQGQQDPFGDFFDRFFQMDPYGQEDPDIKQRSLGSGVMIDPN